MSSALSGLAVMQDLAPVDDWLRPVMYSIAAFGCFQLGVNVSLTRHASARLQQIWFLLCPLYLLVAASCLVHGDTLWVQWARAFAKNQQVYEFRRVVQLGMLLALVVGLSLVLRRQRWKAPFRDESPDTLRSLMLAGAAGTVGLYILRYVSFHYTDLVLSANLVGHSVAFWVEFGSLGVVGLTSGLVILRGDSNV
jgi:hypothetical protein